MTPKKDLEIRGNFLTHPFAEVIAEIIAARLSGAMRAEDKERKRVLYFRDGRLVFAASNARTSRISEMLATAGRLSKAALSEARSYTNDFELTAFLMGRSLLTGEEVNELFRQQIRGILADLLTWKQGEWSFSHLARARDGLDFDLSARQLLIDHARTLESGDVLKRFRSLNERFERSELQMNGLALTHNEAFVLSRADGGSLTAADLASVAAMPEASALHVLYTMWLGGLLEREDWQPAFSDQQIYAMRSARLELRKEARMPSGSLFDDVPMTNAGADADQSPPAPKEAEVTLTVEEYLERVERAATYYDVLGIEPKSDSGEIKRAYFAHAKMFHPDKYHSRGKDLRKRVQNAFTEISQAHETLKDERSRELYDYKVRNELKAREQAAATGETVSESHQLMQAAEHFERGFSLLMEDQIEAALPFLARAVHYAPRNARYRAYYGKALSNDDGQRHKAESEMQAALKLDPNNATFRLMLAEFFMQVGLKKRAEGEVNRLLAVFPSNREAKELLAELKR